MDDQHIDHSFVSPVVEEDMAGSSITRPVSASNSEGPTAIAHPAAQSSVPARFPVEDGGRTLAEMAHQDLDAALQLLAERAQYITGASGAAIALRRSEHNDMICRALPPVPMRPNWARCSPWNMDSRGRASARAGSCAVTKPNATRG